MRRNNKNPEKKGETMKHKMVTGLMLVLVLAFSAFAINDFERVMEIPIPEADLNNGGVGNMIAGVDTDGDGKTEIFLVNDNWNDGATEVIPRIYKLELNAGEWEVVWSAVAPVAYQNTWPPLSLADLDNDGKMELVWGPVNSTSIEANPNRIIVYEQQSADSDNWGVTNGDDFDPNAKWTITDTDGENIRPFQWVITDFNNDGNDNIVFADRTGNSAGYYYGVISVSDIPDNGDGSETWELLVSAKDNFDYAGENKWDVSVIGNNAYFFDELEITKLTWNGSDYETSVLSPLPGGITFRNAQTVDLDGDGTMEIITGEYGFGDGSHGIWLLQEEADTLKRTLLFDINGEDMINGGRLAGGVHGDIDGDGYLDFVFGSRWSGPPNAMIFRLAYRGGDIANPASYEFSIIDSAYAGGTDGIWDVIQLANVDDDPQLEVLYTSSSSYGGDMFDPASSAPVIVLDYTGEIPGGEKAFVLADEIMLNDAVPTGVIGKPGRILNGGEIVWLTLVDGTNKTTYVYRSVDGGETFSYNETPLDGRAAQLDAFDENVALVATANGKIYKTIDGGANWTEQYSYNISGFVPGWFDGLRVLNEDVAVAYGDMEPNGNMHFVRSDDQGDTWTEVTGIDFLSAAYAIYSWGMASCNIGETMWASATTMNYDTAYVFRSDDAGLTWNSYELSTDMATRINAISFRNTNVGMAIGRGGTPFISEDGGETWEFCLTAPGTEDTYINAVLAVPGSNRFLAFGDANEIFYTDDLGESWTQLTVDSENTYDFLGAVMVNPNFGYFFTYQGPVFKLEGQVMSSVSDRELANLPELFQLHQNYPNPFNPTTTISFTLHNPSDVVLNVYDMTGRQVTQLVQGHFYAGTHSVVWDGRDANGRLLSSGVYLYQMRAGNKILAKRMIFMK
jgi:photosystem II stability/assembly factor-like uncharacterized protein